jgi:hypothetical protein
MKGVSSKKPIKPSEAKEGGEGAKASGGEERKIGDRKMAKALLKPELSAAVSIHEVSPNDPDVGGMCTSISAIWEELNKLTSKVAEGDPDYLERVAIAQIATLNALFNSLIQNAWKNYSTPHFEKMMKLGLKAQSQCARTLETLTALKNPAIIAKQLNMANQQVVNNAVVESLSARGRGEASPEAPMADKILEEGRDLVCFTQQKIPTPTGDGMD